MTPLAIQIMLHCYTSHRPWSNTLPRIWDSTAARETRVSLIERGLLDHDLSPTDDGLAYVKALLTMTALQQVEG